MTLDAVVAALPSARAARLVGSGRVAVRGMTHDSRQVEAGMMFACVRGEHHDGHRFAGPAVDAGAAALLVDHALDAPVPQVVVDDTRLAMGPAAARAYGDPSSSLLLVGITGTNGKTTTTHLLASILRAAGRSTGVIGTLSGGHTTPEAPELQARLAEFRDQQTHVGLWRRRHTIRHAVQTPHSRDLNTRCAGARDHRGPRTVRRPAGYAALGDVSADGREPV